MRQVPSLGSADQFYARRAAISNVNESNANWKLRNTCQPAFEKCHYGIAEVATQLPFSSSSDSPPLRIPGEFPGAHYHRLLGKIAETYFLLCFPLRLYFLYHPFAFSLSIHFIRVSIVLFLRTINLFFRLICRSFSSFFFYLRFLWIYPFLRVILFLYFYILFSFHFFLRHVSSYSSP